MIFGFPSFCSVRGKKTPEPFPKIIPSWELALLLLSQEAEQGSCFPSRPPQRSGNRDFWQGYLLCFCSQHACIPWDHRSVINNTRSGNNSRYFQLGCATASTVTPRSAVEVATLTKILGKQENSSLSKSNKKALVEKCWYTEVLFDKQCTSHQSLWWDVLVVRGCISKDCQRQLRRQTGFAVQGLAMCVPLRAPPAPLLTHLHVPWFLGWSSLFQPCCLQCPLAQVLM